MTKNNYFFYFTVDFKMEKCSTTSSVDTQRLWFLSKFLHSSERLIGTTYFSLLKTLHFFNLGLLIGKDQALWIGKDQSINSTYTHNTFILFSNIPYWFKINQDELLTNTFIYTSSS